MQPDDALLRPGPLRGNDGTVEHQVRTVLQQGRVLPAGGLALRAVDHHGPTYARPNDSWTVSVSDRGPEQIEVRFTQTGGASSEIQLHCSRGVPVREN